MTCSSCNKERNTYDDFKIVSLSVARTLHASLSQMTASETLDGPNKYVIERCVMLAFTLQSLDCFDYTGIPAQHAKA